MLPEVAEVVHKYTVEPMLLTIWTLPLPEPEVEEGLALEEVDVLLGVALASLAW
jgi:hypothetical protein